MARKLQPAGANADLATVRVTCRGADLADLATLRPFQGDLKRLSEENYEKLKTAILKYGFSFPMAVWKDGGRMLCIDGHQRDKVLKRMEQEGYRIHRLPVDYIEAKNEKEAKEKILLATSQYGEMDGESLNNFLMESGLEFPELKSLIALPEIDLDRFSDQYFPPNNNNERPHLTLVEQFGIPPFSIFDARQGYWQERKRAWLALGIQSELGRGGAYGLNPQKPEAPLNGNNLMRERIAAFKNQSRLNAYRQAVRPGQRLTTKTKNAAMGEDEK